MIYLSYNAVSSNTYDIVAKSVNRALLPTLTKRELSIPGKHGTYDFGNNTYQNRIITVNMQYIGASFNNLRLNARNIASWLSQETYKELIFSDEPDKFYYAKIYGQVALENLLRLGKATIQFECQPHALLVVTSAEEIYLDDDLPLDMDLILDSGDDYTISL